MLSDLDKTLEELLKKDLESNEKKQHDIEYKFRFEPPSQEIEIESQKIIINLFLYDIRENVELRSSVKSWDKPMKDEGISKRVFASNRIDCSYLITVWTSRQSKGEDKNPLYLEHQILGRIMQILLKYRHIPRKKLIGTLETELPVPIISLRAGQFQNLGEFWQAMGGKPKASIHCTITISVPVDDEQKEEPLVKTKSFDWPQDEQED